ncbi:transmembrane protein 255A isoform X1 [Corvus cornix cornix]|uniref:transmembrane protein 255A isoform X1 n=1 Tax=Corvus cornix cornix TaxID=932674 RepID=UPI0019504E96|nr:transmembrane protein 255A isoform X1 [Corvus cornix cornix]
MRQSLTQQRPAGVALPDSVAWFWVVPWNNRIKLDRKQKANAPPSQWEAGWTVLATAWHRGAQPGCREGVQHRWHRLVSCLLVSWLCACAYIQVLFPEDAVPAERFTYCSLLHPHSSLVASIVFISFGVIAAFCCAIVDGVFAARHIDLRPLYAGRCQYYSKSTTPPEAVCHPQRRAPCTPKIKTNTCFCCDLYNCGNRVEISGGYYEYIDVSSCQDIIHLYHLLWSATILNIVGLFLGIITAAILGGFKDMTPSLPTLNCTVENAHPSVTYYSRPQVTSYNSYYHSTPHLPPYSAYDFQHSSVFPASTPSGLSDDPQSLSPSPSYMWASNAPPRYSPPYFPPFEKPPPYTP